MSINELEVNYLKNSRSVALDGTLKTVMKALLSDFHPLVYHNHLKAASDSTTVRRHVDNLR